MTRWQTIALVLALALAPPAWSQQDKPARPPAADGKRAAPAPARCGGLKGLPLELCQKCDLPGKSDSSRFFCRHGVTTAYCAKNLLKNDPDCQPDPNTNRQNL